LSALGNATLKVTAYNDLPEYGGVSYSPPLTKNFQILTHDIAILKIDVFPLIAYVGEEIKIYLKVKNKGNYTENFDVIAYYDKNLITKIHITSLEPQQQKMFEIHWNTSNIPPGNYTLTAKIPPVSGEVEIKNNELTYEKRITLLPLPKLIVDVAIKDVQPDVTEVYIGKIVNFTVLIQNQGNITLSFNLTLYYNSTLFNTTTLSLPPETEMRIFVLWNTSQVPEGKYVIKAVIDPLPGEIDVENNHYVNGIIIVKVVSPYFLWIFDSSYITSANIAHFEHVSYQKREKKEEWNSRNCLSQIIVTGLNVCLANSL